jgi:hypothetical protein
MSEAGTRARRRQRICVYSQNLRDSRRSEPQTERAERTRPLQKKSEEIGLFASDDGCTGSWGTAFVPVVDSVRFMELMAIQLCGGECEKNASTLLQFCESA